MAHMMTDESIAIGVRLPLYPAQFPPPAPTPQLLPTALNAAGLNSDTVGPFAIPRGFSLTGIAVNYSLANCGDTAPATPCTLDVVVCEVEGTGNTNEHTISVPLPDTHVGAQANTTDNFYDTFYSTEDVSPYWSNSMVGAFLDLRTISAAKVSEIRNPVIGLEFSWYTAPVLPYCRVRDETTFWCGEFAPKLAGELTHRCWDCHFFEATDPETYTMGFCRKWAPSGLSQISVPGFWKTVDEFLWEYTFPYISDGKQPGCGDFKPTAKTPLPE